MIKLNETWATYVLVSALDPECWFTMNINYEKIKERLDSDKKIEKWWFVRTETGDQFLKKEQI